MTDTPAQSAPATPTLSVALVKLVANLPAWILVSGCLGVLVMHPEFKDNGAFSLILGGGLVWINPGRAQ